MWNPHSISSKISSILCTLSFYDEMLWGFKKSLLKILKIRILNLILYDEMLRKYQKSFWTLFSKLCNNDFWNPHSISSQNNKIHKNSTFSKILTMFFEILTAFHHKIIENIRIKLFQIFQLWFLKSSQHFITK